MKNIEENDRLIDDQTVINRLGLIDWYEQTEIDR